MTAVKDRWRLPAEVRTSRPRRPQRHRPNPYRQGLVVGICVGMTGALLIGVLGFLLTRPRTVTPVAAAPSAAATKTAQNPQAAISITSEHLGDLQVRIEAKVSAPGSYNPITKGQVVAYSDMVAMPQAHRQGPIVMAEVAGKPGVYQALSNVPMAGEYNITVEVRQPMASTAHQRLNVGTVPGK